MFNTHASAEADRKRHTIDLLVRTLFSPVYQAHWEKVRSQFPVGVHIKENDIRDSEKSDVFESIRELANFYEFIAVAVYNKDLDKKLLEDCISVMYCAFFKKIEAYILHLRNEYEQGQIPSRIYNNYEALCNEWTKDGPPIPMSDGGSSN